MWSVHDIREYCSPADRKQRRRTSEENAFRDGDRNDANARSLTADEVDAAEDLIRRASTWTSASLRWFQQSLNKFPALLSRDFRFLVAGFAEDPSLIESVIEIMSGRFDHITLFLVTLPSDADICKRMTESGNIEGYFNSPRIKLLLKQGRISFGATKDRSDIDRSGSGEILLKPRKMNFSFSSLKEIIEVSDDDFHLMFFNNCFCVAEQASKILQQAISKLSDSGFAVVMEKTAAGASCRVRDDLKCDSYRDVAMSDVDVRKMLNVSMPNCEFLEGVIPANIDLAKLSPKNSDSAKALCGLARSNLSPVKARQAYELLRSLREKGSTSAVVADPIAVQVILPCALSRGNQKNREVVKTCSVEDEVCHAYEAGEVLFRKIRSEWRSDRVATMSESKYAEVDDGIVEDIEIEMALRDGAENMLREFDLPGRCSLRSVVRILNSLWKEDNESFW